MGCWFVVLYKETNQFWSFLQMNVFSYVLWVTNVPKSHSPDYPTRIRLEFGIICAGREHILAQEYARTVDLNWSIHIQDTEQLSLMKQSWLTCHPQWKCHHRHKTLWLELHSLLSYSLGGSVSALGWTWSGDGFPSSSNITAGCVGFTHRRVVCGPTSEHVLQLLPPLPLDISPGLPLSAVHGKHIFTAS